MCLGGHMVTHMDQLSFCLPVALFKASYITYIAVYCSVHISATVQVRQGVSSIALELHLSQGHLIIFDFQFELNLVLGHFYL